MQLQILVNHYNEDMQIVSRFLSSLEMQKGVDFEVLLYTDGGTKLEENFLRQFNLKIKYKYLSHSGVCHTRNILFDDSTTDYIMFCDVDDCFSSFDGLLSLINEAKKTNADIIGSSYQKENLKQNNYIIYDKDTIRLHGKIFRRQYLIENNIRFPDELEISGDMMFLWLAYALTENFVWIENNFYIWKDNSKSITRHVNYAVVYQYSYTIKCYTLLAYDLIDRNRKDLFDALIATLIPMLFLDSTGPIWSHAPQDSIVLSNFAIKNCLLEFYEYYKQLPEALRQFYFNHMKQYKEEYKKSKDYKDIKKWATQILNLQEEKDVVIIGYGIVGSNLEKELKLLKPEIYDKYKQIDNRTAKKYKVAFICVDTPKTENNNCDISEIENVILSQKAEIYVIKSTVLPETTNKLAEKTKKHIVFSPEYYGNTQHCNNYDFNYTILGGEKEDCHIIIQLLQKAYDGRHQFRIVNSKTAELAKYMENSYLATKVSFCQQFYRIAQKLGIQYEDLRELFVLDPRVNPSHTFVYEETPYWSSHCLDKDVFAIAEEYDAQLLKSIIDYNELCKTDLKLEED